VSVWPVTHAPASLAKYTAAAAMSSGVPKRFIGMRDSAMRSNAGTSISSAVIMTSVGT